MSRWVRDRLGEAPRRAVVLGVQRRACQVAVEDGPLLVLSTPEVPLAPNGLAVAVARAPTLGDAGIRAGQVVRFLASAAPGGAADWVVTLDAAATWEPRPRIHPVGPRALVDRLRTVHAAVVADGVPGWLLPLLWESAPDGTGLGSAAIRHARAAMRVLRDAAVEGDEAGMARGARGLAGLGPGLTPSGDDGLAGFTAAWMLVGDALALDPGGRSRLAAALLAGAERGASALGRAWLAHAYRGELLEPMTRFVATFLDEEARELGLAVRGALAVGSSSGTDWMVGFALGTRTLLDAAARGGAW